MRVSELYDPSRCPTQWGISPDQAAPFAGRDVFLVGSGPSMDHVPMIPADDGLCRWYLNDQVKYATPAEREGCVAFTNRLDFQDVEGPQLRIAKARLWWQKSPPPSEDDNHCRWTDPKYYVFSYREARAGDTISHFNLNCLFLEPDYLWNIRGGSVAIFACQVAALCGVRSITLVGCDCTEWPGEDGVICCYQSGERNNRQYIKRKYHAYKKGLLIIKQELWQRWKVPVYSLTPYVGFNDHYDQWLAQHKWASTSQ